MYSKLNIIVDCKEPVAPANGTVSLTSDTTFSAVVDYECDTEFMLVGNASNVCNQSGQWEPGTPTCHFIGKLY